MVLQDECIKTLKKSTQVFHLLENWRRNRSLSYKAMSSKAEALHSPVYVLHVAYTKPVSVNSSLNSLSCGAHDGRGGVPWSKLCYAQRTVLWSLSLIRVTWLQGSDSRCQSCVAASFTC